MSAVQQSVSKRNRFFFMIILALSAVVFSAGCTGYQFGMGSYTSEIKTVFVHMVEADTYRHGIGERLTEAICKKITDRTPFEITTLENSDSTLVVRLLSDRQYVSALDAYNNTRQKNMAWTVSAVWTDRNGAAVRTLEPTPLTSIGISISDMEFLVAETGQSTATTQQELIEKIADRVVGMMEEKW